MSFLEQQGANQNLPLDQNQALKRADRSCETYCFLIGMFRVMPKSSLMRLSHALPYLIKMDFNWESIQEMVEDEAYLKRLYLTDGMPSDSDLHDLDDLESVFIILISTLLVIERQTDISPERKQELLNAVHRSKQTQSRRIGFSYTMSSDFEKQFFRISNKFKAQSFKTRLQTNEL